ncbi:NAD(P)/FAD-dependent oxidoreductase [Halomicrococcus sp. NG-SE-24]|uniref:NAD(P)/FAD-dependent oxidoreductase n=1 Tax=Halomicrococcus sp. NG-SE-24 TaxID=3436928 RepID=UPI003D9968D0
MTNLQGGALERPAVAVLGGAVAGLAAAERFREFADVTLFERQSYDDKRVNCGEAINEASLVPLEETAENGFLDRVKQFNLEIYATTDRGSEAPITESTIDVGCGYITDRNVIERRWAERLANGEEGPAVDVRDNVNISIERYWDFVKAYDYVVDATGYPSLTTKAANQTNNYTGSMFALNADVRGDFSASLHRPRIVFEGYVGYWWCFPKTETRANVGIGWAGDERPDNYVEAFWNACDRANAPRPDRKDINADTIPQGPNLDPQLTYPEQGVFLVGDAAGIANRYQGEGICQAIRSSYFLARLVQEDHEHEYPQRLYEQMKSEYRLATLMRGVLEETDDVQLVAQVAAAVDGLTVDVVTRHPWRVYQRILQRPRLLTRLVTTPGIRRRLAESYTNRWEYDGTGS